MTTTAPVMTMTRRSSGSHTFWLSSTTAALILLWVGASCDSGTPGGGVDITDATLSSRSADCGDYANSYFANVVDIQRDMSFSGALSIEVGSGSCTFSSNSIPNHDFNDATAQFATPVSEVDATFSVTSDPVAGASVTGISLAYDNGLFLNGVKLDLLAAACYGVGPDPLGAEKIGCNDINSAWRYDPMYWGNSFGTDAHNAHTQPNGAYHYHGTPLALYDDSEAGGESPVIGFAADGFPIFGPYIDDAGAVRKVVSGYTLKAGARVSLPGEAAFPGGSYDGTYRDDYEFTAAGDLDECNGMTRDGVYGYYLSDGYPWVLACFAGTPDESFRK